MAKNTRTYESILDELQALFEKEGHKVNRASFQDDRISFGKDSLAKAYEMSDALLKQLNTTPVGGRRGGDPTPPPDKENSKQVELQASSTIQQAAYWPTKQYLLVSFKSGHTYSYEKVPQATVDLWEFATSAGSFFYYNIRMSYRYQKLG